ncbi:hypothetical protein M3Y98_00262200 [Aphelenchoides besseyi]|nr:hypothetical protein M3Y98_00262200 [Aphelenchoides besseyi]
MAIDARCHRFKPHKFVVLNRNTNDHFKRLEDPKKLAAYCSNPSNIQHIDKTTRLPVPRKQTYWNCDEFDEEFADSSKFYNKKYSLASTVDLNDQFRSEHNFGQLVSKYNLGIYVQSNSADPTSSFHRERLRAATSTNDSNLFQTSHTMDRMDPNQNASLEAVKGVCKIPARLTGFFSLIIQCIAVVGALAITVLIFLHVGGCSLLHLTRNTTAEPELFPTPIVCLGLSLRFEILDLVYINTFVLSVALVYTLVQGILTGTLIFYQCMCTSTIARAIKRRGQNRRRQAAAANYSIPEATHHANVPYIDEPPVQQFSNF